MPWIAAGGAILGGVLGGFGSSSAAKKQQRAAENATAVQRKAADRAMDMQMPFYEGGKEAQNKLMELMGLDVGYDPQVYEDTYRRLRQEASDAHAAQYGFGFDNGPGWADVEFAGAEKGLREQAMQMAKQQYQANPRAKSGEFGSLLKKFSDEDFQADPGYQFRMDEGMRGVEGGAAARGGLLSGAALKAIQKYGQNFASNEYGNAYNRFNADQTNKFNRLTGMIQSGQGSAQQIGNAAQNFGQQAGNNLIQGGNAQASGIMGTTHALVGGINQGINAYQQNQLMNLIRQPAASGWGGGGWGSGNAFGNQDLGQNF
jgi:hypothetical protein